MEHTKRGKCNQPGRGQNWQKNYKTAKQYGLDSKVGLDGNLLHHVLLWEPRWVICMRVLRPFIETKTSEKAFHFCSNNPLWYVKQTRHFLIITLPPTCHLKTIIVFHWIPTYPFLFLICLECSYFERCSHSQTHLSYSYLFI